MIKSCLTCNRDFKTKPSRIKIGRGKYCSKNCFDIDQRINPKHSESKAYQWKGDNASYFAIHRWVYKYLGVPSKCKDCDIENLKAKDGRNLIEWANISGKYNREVWDWKSLCSKCHKKFDSHSEKIKTHWDNGTYINRARIERRILA